jgi:hypothetical protein
MIYFKNNIVLKLSEVHHSDCEFSGLSCKTRIDLTCQRLNIKKKNHLEFLLKPKPSLLNKQVLQVSYDS